MKNLIKTLSIAFVITCLSGCNKHKPMHLLMGIDASGSARRRLGDYFLVTKALAEQLSAGEDKLTLYRVDNNAKEFSDQPYDGNTENLLLTLKHEITDKALQNGTYPAKFWTNTADRATQSKVPVLVVLLSDGDNDDMRPEVVREMKAAAQQLANCPQVRGVVLCGASPTNWQSLRETFKPLGARLTLLSPTEMAADKVTPLLEKTQE
jgi:hypothetical protein